VGVDARGLVAFIVTVHEVAALLAILVAALLTSLGALLLRNTPSGRRFLTIAAFAIGGALLTFAVTARLFRVSALDVEVVRVSE
jgi:hypothetical protein